MIARLQDYKTAREMIANHDYRMAASMANIDNTEGQQDRRRPGPAPDSLNIEGDWEQAIGKALKKKRPNDGWPKPTEKDKDKKKD